ncbi:MAG TPA: helix-turn-helix domain-containing protein [Solirubrobacterales bacterium]|nr:helix-turn-helix domain-containing protein [Solirubrobacterales bacterium]
MDEGVGKKLREARTRKKLSLQAVEEATKIRGRYLQALENDEWDQLPGDIYARAFIRTYGRYLGLDGDRLAEEQRQDRGAARPGERLPRVDPKPGRVARPRSPRGRRTVPPRLLAVLVTGLVVAALVVIGLSTGGSTGGGSGSGAKGTGAATEATGKQKSRGRQAAAPGHSLRLAATGEVWVCLMNGREKPLVDGQILGEGESVGPFRSGSFTLALGNGAVTMTVDGRQAKLPEPASPIGFAVGADGKVRELPEGERPTCA